MTPQPSEVIALALKILGAFDFTGMLYIRFMRLPSNLRPRLERVRAGGGNAVSRG